MAELTPADGTEIISTTEDVGASQLITSDLDEVTSWDWDFIGLGTAPDNPPALQATDQGASLLIEYVPDDGLFPLEYVDYMDPDRNRIREFGPGAWDLIPDPELSPEIVEMREDRTDLLQWNAEVTATGLTAGVADTASATYLITVFANYDLNRDILVEEVNARR